MTAPVSAENFPAREGENSHSAKLAKEMKTVKAQRDEGLKSTRDCKEVTQNGGIRERSRYRMAAVCIFFARLDYVTLDLTNMSALQDAKSASLIAKCRLPRKDLSSQSGRKYSIHLVGCCLDQSTSKRGWMGLNVTLSNKVIRFLAVWRSQTTLVSSKNTQENPRKSITNPRVTTPGF